VVPIPEETIISDLKDEKEDKLKSSFLNWKEDFLVLNIIK